VLAAVLAGGVFAAASAGAQEHRLWVGLDLDLDDSTGCSLDGADSSGIQTADGFEWVAEVSITPSGSAAEVTKIENLGCDDAETRTDLAWASVGSDASTPWNVGHQVEDPISGLVLGDVVELEIDTADLGIGNRVRIALLSESAGGHRDTLLTLDGTSAGASIVFPGVENVPSLSGGALGTLVLLLFASAWVTVRRSVLTLALWIFALGLSAERGIAAIALVADGFVEDWGSLRALASDPAEDSETNDPAADILDLFVDWSGSNLAVRVDVADLSAEVCAHSETPCSYLSAGSGESLSDAVSALAEGARLVIESGDYQVAGKLDIPAKGIHILAADGVTLHNTIGAFEESGGWVEVVGSNGIYRSADAYEITSLSTHSRAWGRFYVDEEAFMLMPYACYEALSSANTFYPADETTLSDPPDCDQRPYVGPGLYWDKDGSQSDALGLGSTPGHIFIRMDTSPEPLNSLVADPDFSIDEDPNDTVMEITIDGPRLQLEFDDIVVSNLTMELGSIRIGASTEGGELRDIVLDGPTYDAPIEVYTGASDYLFDGLTIEQNFPAWITWKDTKKLFYDTIRYSAISLNGRDADDMTNGIEAIHDIRLRNSTIQNVHDGLELNGDSYHHLYIADNTFLNVQDDGIQLGSSAYEIEIARNRFEQVGTSISRHGTGANEFPGYKYIHHNYIDASTPKYYCREIASGDYGETSCDSEGKLTLRGFHLHEGSGWYIDGDPRYYYNNTVIVNGEMIGVGFQGQDYQTQCTGTDFENVGTVGCSLDDEDSCTAICIDESDDDFGELCANSTSCVTCSGAGTCSNHELPYSQPSLVFNNVFVQLDNVASSFVESPKWSILAPPVLITGGNLYYQPPPPYACYGDDFPGELGHTYRCDPEATDDPCNSICVSGDNSLLAQPCGSNGDCNSSGKNDGRCSSSADCQMTDRIFEMSNSICGLEGFQADHCKGVGSWSPQISPEWDYGSTNVLFSWNLEEGGLQDSSELDQVTYVPDCGWLSEQLDSTMSVIEPIDLSGIDEAYSVTVNGVEKWSLSLEKPLPGVDPGDPYRGVTPCVNSGE